MGTQAKCFSGVEILVHCHPVVKDKTFTLKLILGIFFQVFEYTTLKLEHLFIPFLLKFFYSLVTPDASGAKNQDFFILGDRKIFHLGKKVAKLVSLRVNGALECSDFVFIPVSGVDHHPILFLLQNPIPFFWFHMIVHFMVR